MYGAIIGDMIGAPYEFDRGNKTKDFPLFSRRSEFTDDSVMTIAVAEALMDTFGKNDDEIRKALVVSMQKWGRRYPDAGYGGRFYHWLKERHPEPYGSYGNGSAMRVSAAGWLFDTLEETRHMARLTADVTHNHPEGIKGAEAAASAIFMARNGSSKDEIKAYIHREFGYDLTRTCDEIRPGYHHMESCQKTVPEAITAFLEGNDFEDVIRTAVSLGGDCDTLTCIAGSMAEAMYGVPEEIKAECRKRLPKNMLEVLDRFQGIIVQKNDRSDCISTVEIRKISITDLDTDAIVNAANEGLWAGGGVCGAIFMAAGHKKLQEACDRIGHCKTGSAVITPGFDLKAGYIIHAVGPRWSGGKHNEPKQLYGAYYRALELAVENGCRSIGFPLISAGIFGYPVRQAWDRAFDACSDFLDKHKDVSLNIVFAVLNDEIRKTGQKALINSEASRYKVADRNDWVTGEMPDQHDIFIYRRPFTAQQMALLRRGHIPREMEDKWFWYMEGDTLFAHRSWTGYCIFRVDFKPDNDHVVTVNRDPDQYICTNTAEDANTLNNLLNWWTQETYDYYSEWLAETYETLKKEGKIPDDRTGGDY